MTRFANRQHVCRPFKASSTRGQDGRLVFANEGLDIAYFLPFISILTTQDGTSPGAGYSADLAEVTGQGSRRLKSVLLRPALKLALRQNGGGP